MLREEVPRALCLGVRAGDLRINAMRAALVPEDAFDRVSGREPRGREAGVKVGRLAQVEPREHEVLVDAGLLREVCGPVWLPGEGVSLEGAGALLGRQPETLRGWVRTGALLEERVRRTDRTGASKMRLLVRASGPLDPASSEGRPPGAWWGTMWQWLSGRVGDDFEQVVVRVPEYRPYKGVERFRGWSWLCPGCGRRARFLHIPTRGDVYRERWAGATRWARERGGVPGACEGVSDGRWGAAWSAAFETGEEAEPMQTLACYRCHGVDHGAGGEANRWNQVVTVLSGGLLFGREVKVGAVEGGIRGGVAA